MNDIYDDAIQAVMDKDNIRASWLAGAGSAFMPLDGLLFRVCTELDVCLTEYKAGMGNQHINKELYDRLQADDLIPLNQWCLATKWDESDEDDRLQMLQQFAMYNRELDVLYHRDEIEIRESC